MHMPDFLGVCKIKMKRTLFFSIIQVVGYFCSLHTSGHQGRPGHTPYTHVGHETYEGAANLEVLELSGQRPLLCTKEEHKDILFMNSTRRFTDLHKDKDL